MHSRLNFTVHVAYYVSAAGQYLPPPPGNFPITNEVANPTFAEGKEFLEQ